MKFDFINRNGQTLSAKLDLPAGEAKVFALFAHCFTCSKDIIASSTISRELTRHGIGVLRFDFTGLGNSEGEFANTNFSSNVDDLVDACTHLKKHYKAPQLLIGHSLGGTAVLMAAQKLDNIKAVVTIGAPSDVKHLKKHFINEISEIQNEGQATAKLSGREFTIKKQFLDDIENTSILDNLDNAKFALLVLHSPLDDVVSIDHASKIFLAAKHPKSFVSLDKANHLLMQKTDAQYVAKVIAAWCDRYLSIEMPELNDAIPKDSVVVKGRPETKFTQDIFTQDHRLIADEPLSFKGDNQGMNPYELLLAGLGACTSMTMKMYANHKGIPLENVEVELKHKKIHAEDCAQCDTKSGKIDQIEKKILLIGNLSEEQKSKLLEISSKCPVNRTLLSEVEIKASLIND